ncbi:hypothetical protein TIFTF001_015618 [Ficus carica]|uniref:Uncharacterized protein n=1 Tax=Ficus carica TaxID=3494 RepID=A0AA88AI20_FICCA|nr:hypothetical protein TIFTF001_015618 [Ficus carica]
MRGVGVAVQVGNRDDDRQGRMDDNSRRGCKGASTAIVRGGHPELNIARNSSTILSGDLMIG